MDLFLFLKMPRKPLHLNNESINLLIIRLSVVVVFEFLMSQVLMTWDVFQSSYRCCRQRSEKGVHGRARFLPSRVMPHAGISDIFGCSHASPERGRIEGSPHTLARCSDVSLRAVRGMVV